MNLNKVFLIGRLTQDPQVKTTPSGHQVCTFGLATNRFVKDPNTGELKEKTEYHNIVLWRRLAEIAAQYLKRGALVFIEGRLQTRTWQDSNGNSHSRTEIVAERIQLGPKGTIKEISKEEKTPSEEEIEEEIPIIEEDEEIKIEDIPF
jgi:single-strand DNA-binding protein